MDHNPVREPAARCAAAAPSFGLGALLLVLGILGGCLALGRVDPLLAVVAASISATALMRTSRITARSPQPEQTPGNGAKFVVFISSIGMIVAAIAALVLTAGIAAATAWLAGYSLEAVFHESWIPIVATVWGLVIGLPAGLFAAEQVVVRWRSPL